MLCIGERHEIDFSKGDFEDMDKAGALDLGSGVYMYTRNTSEEDLGKESEKAEYCFCALGCHEIGRKTKESMSALMALGVAVNLQKTIGGHLYWCEEPEGFTYYLGGMEAFMDRTYDWWCWPFPDDWWASYVRDGCEVVGWKALAEECTDNMRDWYMSIVSKKEEMTCS